MQSHGIGQGDGTDPILTMQAQWLRARAIQGRRSPLEHRNIFPPGESQEPAGIASGGLNTDVSRHRRDSDDVELGRSEREKNADGIVDPGIGVDDGHAGFCMGHDEDRNLLSPSILLSDNALVLTIATGAS